jgi:hypothetical protein
MATSRPGWAGSLQDVSARTLVAGDLAAVFLPDHASWGLAAPSGVESLRRVQDLEADRGKGSTAGIPLLHLRANRLAGLAIAPAGGWWSSIRRRRCCTSTSTGCRSTACHGPGSAGAGTRQQRHHSGHHQCSLHSPYAAPDF